MLGGVISGLLGIGGGPVYVIILSYFINKMYGGQVSESTLVKLIIASTIFSTLFAALSGSIKQYLNHNFYPKTVLTIAIPALLSTMLVSYWVSTINYSKLAFSLLFIALMVPLLYRMLSDKPNKKQFNQPFNIKIGFMIMLGTLSGALTALSGLGGGFAIIPLMNSLFNIKIKKVMSISLGVIFIVALANTFLNIFVLHYADAPPGSWGGIIPQVSLPMIAGVVIGSPIGVYIAKRMSPSVLRYAFVAFCCIIIIKTIIGIVPLEAIH